MSDLPLVARHKVEDYDMDMFDGGLALAEMLGLQIVMISMLGNYPTIWVSFENGDEEIIQRSRKAKCNPETRQVHLVEYFRTSFDTTPFGVECQREAPGNYIVLI